ncbi:PREDICTED: biotin carboxyl carrier protein of acetyl-CoA carboxylase 2, chloroplastic-like [Tarenaya hassleriana]|uniref:biotin carboxyl carrier protein of acetyl-CoA carboxylase 2, chloroplastic-like n=1 Tax=Tarenaya hassleriana TaxID=28532 RepID=UPI00053C44D5|nr:PREDICTED: biotin carboxyl carrier protein of acetyl-CoA carboxylase 2, chloroplastic-like [Tarenaya hassleriana]
MASLSLPCPKICASNRFGSISGSSHRKLNRISFSNVSDASQVQPFNQKQSAFWSLHATVDTVASNSEVVKSGSLNGKAEIVDNNVHDPAVLPVFMAQVSDLVKLVDSRDIVELELKQLDCEIIIRKKEALQQPVAAAPPAAAAPLFSMPPPMVMPPAQPADPSSAPSASVAAPAAPASPSPSHPPLKSPMAGTFYRSPAPGEPPFIKVGDKIQKGQVVCIIEAMKLMNEIEADQSGTVAKILAEDGKPVSLDTPLLVIVP